MWGRNNNNKWFRSLYFLVRCLVSGASSRFSCQSVKTFKPTYHKIARYPKYLNATKIHNPLFWSNLYSDISEFSLFLHETTLQMFFIKVLFYVLYCGDLLSASMILTQRSGKQKAEFLDFLWTVTACYWPSWQVPPSFCLPRWTCRVQGLMWIQWPALCIKMII